jgi:hypothetical protein
MSKLIVVIAMLVGLSACHGGISGGIGDSGQPTAQVATNAR